ncbi:extracellular solute-binding protein [Nioella sediminis]|jgi:iron(III) transport system substrate-binding protein|uniref:extracellular solute-binding protein n=1 Tax=Nioella sediminis TaxID=1912092 RepID=UPI0008FD5E5E|nr:extracellular solute-binding protein [Nioella sediminis]TBX20463.1 iron deficiency-induced protein A [Roseovarius sp. JS7-11]
MTRPISTLLAASILASTATMATAQELNIYSSRHYDTDEALYSGFEEATGITINRIEGDADELMARMQAEGRNSPADIFITVDVSRLNRAVDAGLLQPVDSDVLEARIPANLQDAENRWFGFSQRSRILFYNTDLVDTPPATYADLADPAYEGLVCIRSSTNTYNQTLLASIIAHEGEDAARDWAEGVVRNFARSPQGGDTDQIRGVASGECGVAVSNTYYYVRSLRDQVDGVTEHLDVIGYVFPDQDGNGAHMNVSGAGVAVHSPNREAAVAFLEYLASDSAQVYFSSGNNEYPAVEGVEMVEELAGLGEFVADDVDLSDVAANLGTAQRIFNQVGWP